MGYQDKPTNYEAVGTDPYVATIPFANETSDSNQGKKGRNMLVACVAFVVAVVAGAFWRSSSTVLPPTPPTDAQAQDQDMLGAANSRGSGARACTFLECVSSNCDAEVAPYICLFHNGGPHMGCSPVEWTEFTCSEQCDLSGCDDLDIPDDIASCKGVECTKEWCAGGQVCPDKAPYQCTDGSARFGCSTDSFHWVLGGAACVDCCDTSTC